MDPAAALALPAAQPPAPSALAAAQVAALVPCHRELPRPELLADVAARVGSVLIVDDGMPERLGSTPAELGRAEVLRLPANVGKGHAVARGLAALLARRPAPRAVLVIDADGQHPPDAIPRFLAAAGAADLVVGDRLADTSGMPLERRLSNRLSTAILACTSGAEVRDSQCGMRLLRGRALLEVAFPEGAYESETRHLKRCLEAGVRVAWVPIPAIYDGEPSSFRRLRDTLRVARALVT